jgi:lysophospholipase L1-like esterase
MSTAQREFTRTRPLVLWSLLALAVLLVALGVFIARRDRPSVVLLGDSITAGARPTLRSVLHDRYGPTIDGRGGMRVGEMWGAAENASAFPFSQVVINLGTNDVLADDQDLDESLVTMAGMATLFPQADCVHLVTISEVMQSPTVDAGARARQFNAGLRELAASEEQIHLVDWAGIVSADEGGDPENRLTDDSVHPNAAGNRLLAEAYEEALDRCR